MSPSAARLNLACAAVRELRRALPDRPLARAAVWATSTWSAVAHRGGCLATVTRESRPGWLPGVPIVPPFLTYRPDREGD